MFDEDAGVIDSFIPTYSFEKRKDDVLMIGARLFGALLTVGCFYKLSEIHSLSDVGNVSSKAFLDILEWGHQKLADTPANDDSIRLRDAKTPEEIEKIHWERCVQHCEFQDFDEFKVSLGTSIIQLILRTSVWVIARAWKSYGLLNAGRPANLPFRTSSNRARRIAGGLSRRMIVAQTIRAQILLMM